MGCRLRVECAVLNGVAREGHTWEVTFEQRPEGERGASHGDPLKGRLFGAAGTVPQAQRVRTHQCGE